MLRVATSRNHILTSDNPSSLVGPAAVDFAQDISSSQSSVFGVSGIPLTYERPENGEVGKEPDSREEHVEPGESFVFKIPEDLRKGWLRKSEGAQNL